MIPDSSSPSLDFIICVEKGYFEKQAMLLVATIRAFGGVYRNAPIYCYSPRKGLGLSRKTIQFLESQNVKYSDKELNKDFKYYHFANKPMVCAYHEQVSKSSRIFYLDCDTILLTDPSPLLAFNPQQIVARPEDAKGFATSPDFDDENAAQWKALFEYFGITDFPVVQTVMDNQTVVSYYNAGQIITARETGFYTQWNDMFHASLSKKLFQKRYLILAEQMMFSVSIAKLGLAATGEGRGFNFPLNLHAFDTILNPLYNHGAIADQITLHYHKIFLRGENPVFDELSSFDSGQKINEMLEEFDMFQYQSSLKSKVRRRLHAWLSERKYT